MTEHPIVVGILLTVAATVAIFCATGMALMRDTLQRLHYSAPVVSLSAGLIAIAVWIDDAGAEARIKSLLIVALLFATNSILTHATARAVRVQQAGHWAPRPDERIPIAGRQRGRRKRRR